MFQKGELVQQLGDSHTNEVTRRFAKFAWIPPHILESIKTSALTEDWGIDHWVLKKYLSIQVAWSIEQGLFTCSENQFYTTAGHLQTRYGTPLYLVFTANNIPLCPWKIIFAGPNILAPALPSPPAIPTPAPIPPGAEIVVSHEHILGQRAERVPFLKDTPPVAQMCAVSGAIQWSLNRGLQMSHWYFGKMDYWVPLYLSSREDITRAPDAVAPIEVQPDRLLVRTVFPPADPYNSARVAVKRHDQLPAWLLAGWANAAANTEEEAVDEFVTVITPDDASAPHA